MPRNEKVKEKEVGVAAWLKEYKGVWVFVEHTDGRAAHVPWELLGVGADLAKTLGVELCAIVIADKVEDLCLEAFAYGDSTVYLIASRVFVCVRPDPYNKATCDLQDTYKPEID